MWRKMFGWKQGENIYKIENRNRAAACHYIKLDSDAQFLRLISRQRKILMYTPLNYESCPIY